MSITDEDGVDKPFNKAMDAAMREDVNRRGPLAPVIVPVRDYIAGKASVPKRTGDCDGCLGGKNGNHVRWCRTWKYAGNPDAGAEIVAFHERERAEGLNLEEPFSGSHEIQSVAPVLCNVAIALKRHDKPVLDSSAWYMRTWLTGVEPFRLPRKKGERIPPVHFAGARETSGDMDDDGEADVVDQRQPIAELLTLLLDGIKPTRNLDALDRTCLWAALQPRVLPFVLEAVKGRTFDADRPALVYAYHLAKWDTGHLGWWEGDLAAMYAPAKWVLSDYRTRKLTTGDDPRAKKLSRGNTLHYPPMPPVPPGARVMEYPRAKG